MSDMLEQAIIDAGALKEAAVKNAESLVLDKFSDQIKEAVENLLEQEEDPMAAGGEAPAAPAPAEGGEEEVEESSVMQSIPLANQVAEDAQVEIPLESLMEQLQELTDGLEEEFDMDEDLYEETEEELYEEMDMDEDLYEADDDMLDPADDLDEEFLSELDELSEQLEVDIHPQKSGWVGMPNASMELATEDLLALEQDSQVREEKAAVRKAVAALKATNESLTKKNKKAQKTLNESHGVILKLKTVLEVLQEKLEASTLLNAKLLYQNKALISVSLNERQKHKLVEAVSNADSIEEAKVIYEALQNSVGSTNPAKQPKSLNEAVEKSSSIIMSNSRRPRQEERRKEEPAFDRWKFLAGINKD